MAFSLAQALDSGKAMPASGNGPGAPGRAPAGRTHEQTRPPAIGMGNEGIHAGSEGPLQGHHGLPRGLDGEEVGRLYVTAR